MEGTNENIQHETALNKKGTHDGNVCGMRGRIAIMFTQYPDPPGRKRDYVSSISGGSQSAVAIPRPAGANAGPVVKAGHGGNQHTGCHRLYRAIIPSPRLNSSHRRSNALIRSSERLSKAFIRSPWPSRRWF